MKRLMTAAAACAATCLLLSGCESSPVKDGEKVIREQAYAPTGTFIPRKNGTGLGAPSIGTVHKQDVENARAMNSSGQGGRNGF